MAETSTIIALISTLGLILSAFLGAFFGWLASRDKAKQSDLTALINKQKEENDSLKIRVTELELQLKTAILEKEVVTERRNKLADMVQELQTQLIEAHKLKDSLRRELDDARTLVKQLKNQKG